MNCYIVNLQGKRHIYEGRPCEDAVAVNKKDKVFVLADGVTNSSAGGLGAEERVNALVSFLASAQVKDVLAHRSASEIRALVTAFLQKEDERLCAENPGTTAEDFASTLLAAVGVGNMMCIIHAGDGVVFGCPNTVQTGVTVISGPDNGPNGSVFHSGHQEQKRRMRVIRVCSADYKKIVLSSDGFSDAYYRPYENNFKQLARLLDAEDEETFGQLCEKDHARISDDISCVVIDTLEERATNVGAKSAKVQTKPEDRTRPIAQHDKVAARQEEKKHETLTAQRKNKPDSTQYKGAFVRCNKKRRNIKATIAAVFVALLLAAEMATTIYLATKVYRIEGELATTQTQISEINSHRRGIKITEVIS